MNRCRTLSESQAASRPRLLLVVSAPSGAGKTTLCDRLRERFPALTYSVSATTRPPREGEVSGTHYHFLDRETFVARRDAGAFLEWAEVHGNFYGTLIEEVERAFAAGFDVLMDVDVQGAALIREAVADGALSQGRMTDVFISPPSLDELERRLRSRGQDSDAVIRRRLDNAAGEMACRDAYMHQVVNDDLDAAYAELEGIVVAEHARDNSSS